MTKSTGIMSPPKGSNFWRIALIAPMLFWAPDFSKARTDASQLLELSQATALADGSAEGYEIHPVKAALQSLEFNVPEAEQIVAENRNTIIRVSRAYGVPAWMVAGIIYVETAQGVPSAWHWNDSASASVFTAGARPASIGIMQVRQDPSEMGLDHPMERAMFAAQYREDVTTQIVDGSRHLAAVLAQPNRLGPDYRAQRGMVPYTEKMLRTIAHEYNSGPDNWKGTSFEDAVPLDYGELFMRYLPRAYEALYREDFPASLY